MPNPGYHISGCLEVAPEGVLKKRFGAVRPILEAVAEAVKVGLLPLPRFVKKPCSHILNFMEDDFEYILLGAASTCRHIIAN